MITDEKYMAYCLELARLGRQTVAPNPMVGCVIVHEGKIIGQGYHRKYGGPHAEVEAINSVSNQSLLTNSTLYVNLEPCAHHGKTPPCSELIIEKKIPRVIIGCKDSFAQVAGKGIDKMRKAGIDVKVGVLEKESLDLNKRFFVVHSEKRPYIMLKWAETIDGYIDIDRNSGNTGISWITHPYLRIPVHKWRSEEAGIIIGTKTALNDNPKLNNRLWSGNSPTRFIIDKDLELPKELSIFEGDIPTYIFTEKKAVNKTNITFLQIDFSNNLIPQILNYLYNLEIQSLIVEGGRTLLQSFINQNLWDEARVFVGNKTFGSGAKGPLIQKKMDDFCQFGNDRLLYFSNKS